MNAPSMFVSMVFVVALLINIRLWFSTKRDIEDSDLDDKAYLLEKDKNFFFRSAISVVLIFVLGLFLGLTTWPGAIIVIAAIAITEVCVGVAFFFLSHQAMCKGLHEQNS